MSKKVEENHQQGQHHKKKKYQVKGYQWKDGKCTCDTIEFDIFEIAVEFVKSSEYHFAKIFSEIGEMIHEIVNHHNHDKKHDHDNHGHHEHYA